ncbi:MAG: transposase [Chthoniobacterales bacterium]
MIRFTPRRRRRIWSAINIRRVVDLTNEKRMHPAGLTAFAARVENKSDGGLVAARGRRQTLRRHMAGEILGEEKLLRLARLCGLSLVTIYGLQAAIGDIARFAQSKKLVAYLGLNPSVSQSGDYQGATALKRHGRGALCALLIQSANPESFRGSRSKTRCKSGAWRWRRGAGETKRPWPSRANSASPSGTS